MADDVLFFLHQVSVKGKNNYVAPTSNVCIYVMCCKRSSVRHMCECEFVILCKKLYIAAGQFGVYLFSVCPVFSSSLVNDDNFTKFRFAILCFAYV